MDRQPPAHHRHLRPPAPDPGQPQNWQAARCIWPSTTSPTWRTAADAHPVGGTAYGLVGSVPTSTRRSTTSPPRSCSPFPSRTGATRSPGTTTGRVQVGPEGLLGRPGSPASPPQGSVSMSDMYQVYQLLELEPTTGSRTCARSVMADDFVYAISDSGIRVANIANLSRRRWRARASTNTKSRADRAPALHSGPPGGDLGGARRSFSAGRGAEPREQGAASARANAAFPARQPSGARRVLRRASLRKVEVTDAALHVPGGTPGRALLCTTPSSSPRRGGTPLPWRSNARGRQAADAAQGESGPGHRSGPSEGPRAAPRRCRRAPPSWGAQCLRRPRPLSPESPPPGPQPQHASKHGQARPFGASKSSKKGDASPHLLRRGECGFCASPSERLAWRCLGAVVHPAQVPKAASGGLRPPRRPPCSFRFISAPAALDRPELPGGGG